MECIARFLNGLDQIRVQSDAFSVASLWENICIVDLRDLLCVGLQPYRLNLQFSRKVDGSVIRCTRSQNKRKMSIIVSHTTNAIS